MMGRLETGQGRLFYDLCLEKLVPSDHPVRKLDAVLDLSWVARELRQPPPGVIHHSDRGSQYCSNDYRKLLKAHGFLASMSG